MRKIAPAACLFAVLAAAFTAVLAFSPGSERWFERLQVGRVAWFAMYGAFAVVIGASLLARYRGRFVLALGQALIWLLLLAALVVAYTFKDDFALASARVLAQLEPGYVASAQPGEASVARRLDGGFVVDAKVSGAPVQMVFDTGATTIELRAEDADRIGLPVDRLRYDEVVGTANGDALAAPVLLDKVTIGGIAERRVPALVAKPGALSESLLGRSFLDRLSSFSVEHSQLVMRGR